MATTRTSDTHPLWIDEVRAGDAGGLIGITFCPGKCGPSISGYQWERSLSADLDVIAQWAPSAMVTLIEDHEFRLLKVEAMEHTVRQLGMDWMHLPIRDVDVPDLRFESGWQSAGPSLHARLEAGERVATHCRGGIGRTGLVAALILVERGWSGEAAIRHVRAARPRAIETRAQERYVTDAASAIGG